MRKQQLQYQPNLYGQQTSQVFSPIQLQQPVQQPTDKALSISETLNVQSLDLDSLDQDSLVLKDESPDNLLTASILQQFQSSSIKAAFVGSPVSVPIKMLFPFHFNQFYNNKNVMHYRRLMVLP